MARRKTFDRTVDRGLSERQLFLAGMFVVIAVAVIILFPGGLKQLAAPAGKFTFYPGYAPPYDVFDNNASLFGISFSQDATTVTMVEGESRNLTIGIVVEGKTEGNLFGIVLNKTVVLNTVNVTVSSIYLGVCGNFGCITPSVALTVRGVSGVYSVALAPGSSYSAFASVDSPLTLESVGTDSLGRRTATFKVSVVKVTTQVPMRSNQLVYNSFYLWHDSKWEKYNVSTRTSMWLKEGVYTWTLDSSFADGENYILVFACNKHSGVWRCGCSSIDGPCNQWMLQTFKINKVSCSGDSMRCVDNTTLQQCTNGIWSRVGCESDETCQTDEVWGPMCVPALTPSVPTPLTG